MYPFLPLPSLYAHYNLMWEVLKSDRTPGLAASVGQDDRILTCQLFGRCTASPRISQEDGRHSAGWSLYKAAMNFMGDIMDCFEGCKSQIRVLQALELIVLVIAYKNEQVIYLFRLDMIGKAESFLALAVSHAYSLNLHTAHPAGCNSNQEREMCRQARWCLYLLDRRLAIESRRPFLIQDANITTPLPQIMPNDISQCDEIMTSCEESSNTSSQVVDSVTFFYHNDHYSKIIGRTWERIYSPNGFNGSHIEMKNHLEALVSQAQTNIPSQFAYDLNPIKGPCINYEGTSWWLVKQQTLMQVRWLSLRLMIHTSMLKSLGSGYTDKIANFENEVISMTLSSKLIELFLQISEQKDIFTFPFFHYLITAAIISLGLLIKESAFKLKYGSVTLRAIQLLKSLYSHLGLWQNDPECLKTWTDAFLSLKTRRCGLSTALE
ncbi:hypothetical protein N7493_011163 [Penicillium malachiteum]|uniref:Xylanolytic transcriptional activator regulatory domain-containing protein n=1 Tax=Penicillium malachiteum TaxID=1324776 RepID=A0AAD6HBM4_9EURO|nr:hypothetical protein N7493_011163 [Penicillium malachiteum]